MLVQYFAKHENDRNVMANAAYDWMNKNFSPEQFWQSICGRLNLDPADLG